VPESVKKITLEILEDYTLVEQLLDDNPHFEIFSGFFDQVIDIDTFIEFAKIISLILGTRSIFTRNHLSLVARTSEAIARSMLGTLDGKVMKLAGFVHDVGKIKTPLSILHKKGKLTDEEWILMKKHVVDTVHTLQEADLRFLAVICGAHHERLDGSGYPMGLVEDQMTIYQKILQVADVYSALIERRPYRSAVSYREALDIVKKEVEKGRLDEKVFNELKNVVLSEPALMRTRYSDVLKDFFGDHYREIAEILKDVLWSR
ncbi:MAG: phosphohydrolase, partial [Thermotogae bacterium]